MKPEEGMQRQETGNPKAASDNAAKAKEPGTRQLSYKEKREFASLEQEIAALTKEKENITEKLNSGNTGFEELQELSKRIGEVTRLLDEKELRWLELSELAG